MDYFQDATTQRFTFVSYASGVSETTFAVMRFSGLEAISTPYEFEIMLVSGDPDLDMSALLQSQAVFTIHRDAGDDVAYNGILAEFDQLHAYNEHYFYRAKLVPKIWWLMQTQHNQVFLEKTVPEIIEGALVDGGMDSLDYDVSALEGTYNPVEYVCQYGESHFNFVSRWLEREGVYYYFYHDVDGDKLVLSDSSFSHEPFKHGADLVYSPKTGMEQGHLDEIILNFTCRQKQLPNRIVLKDHNPERPSLEMAVHADVDPDGRGETFLYGEHYATPEEGERLIAFRAEELLCTKQSFHGDSTVPFLTPGFKFNMNQHYRSAFNQEYMVTSVTHEGDQTNLLKTSVIGSLSDDAEINIYSNSFTAIPADRQYRHPRTADRPRISGTLHGKIDGEQESPYAQLDEQGRYKVKLPFDINDEHIDGKASARVRMMQPYAGEGKGMQFPLTKGTEVLLTFIDGNPDRPVIAGAVSSETAPSPVNAENQSESVIRSAGNNRIRMEDKAGKERMVFQSAMASSWIRIGTPNDPISLLGSSPMQFDSTGASPWVDPQATVESPDPADPNLTVSSNVDADWVRLEAEVDDASPTDVDLTAPFPEGIYIAHYSSGDETVRRRIFSYDVSDLNHPYAAYNATDGIRNSTNGSYWVEAQGRYGHYVDGYPNGVAAAASSTSNAPSNIANLLFNFVDTAEPSYAPTGMIPRFAGQNPQTSFIEVLRNAEVRVSSFDTVTTQEGNIYDFGGYWNYNLGNSYEEAHTNQSAKLNQVASLNSDHKKAPNGAYVFGDLLDIGGPGWTSINWIADKGINSKIPVYEDADSVAWHSDNVWTTKEFGNSYDIRNGSAISITNGSTLDISYTGHTQVELVMRSSGNPATYMRKEPVDGTTVTTEKKWSSVSPNSIIYDSTTTADGSKVTTTTTQWDRTGSAVNNFKTEFVQGLRSADFEFDYSNVASAKISAASKASFSLDMSVSASVSLNASANIAFTGNGLDVDMKGHILGVEMKLNSMKTEVSLLGMSAETNGGLFRFKQAPPTELEQSVMKLEAQQLELRNVAIILKNVNGLDLTL